MKVKKRKKSGAGRRRDIENSAVPKVCGSDIELGNFFEGKERRNGTGDERENHQHRRQVAFKERLHDAAGQPTAGEFRWRRCRRGR